MTTGSMIRAAFVTIGQSPRDDMVPEIALWAGRRVDIVEYGALDDLSREEILALAPGEAQHRLVTRLRDGSEVVVAKDLVRERVQRLFGDMSPTEHDVIVLLCTGHFTDLEPPRGIFLEAQRLVDLGVAAFTEGTASIGIMVPLAKQIDEFHYRAHAGQTVRMTHASPYGADRIVEAAREIADTDLLVMHCMGYSEAMRDVVVRTAHKPVLLARRLVGAAIAQLA